VAARRRRAPRKRGRGGPRLWTPLLVVAGGAALALIIWALPAGNDGGGRPASPLSGVGVTDHSPPLPRHLAGSAGSPPGGSANPAGKPAKGVLIIIDDLGHNRPAAAPFLAFDRPLGLAFLPGRPRSRELAEEAHAGGKSVFLHLPMEPVGYPAVDPGPGSLLTSMAPERAREVLADDLAQVPYAEAVNNHEGSRATADEALMGAVLGELHRRGLAFVDSLTSSASVTRKVARRLGARRLSRDIFLDNDRSPDRIRARGAELFRLAEARGWAVAIGHPYPETAEALPWLRAEAERRGIAFLTLKEVLSRADAGD